MDRVLYLIHGHERRCVLKSVVREAGLGMSTQTAASNKAPKKISPKPDQI